MSQPEKIVRKPGDDTGEAVRTAFSENLKRARGKRTQAEFARMLGIPGQQTYQRYESGLIIPSGDVLHRIATRLGVSIDGLLSKGELSAPPSVSETIRQMVRNPDFPVPSDSELDEQMIPTAAIAIFAEVMTAKQLNQVSQLLLSPRSRSPLSPKQTNFLARVVSGWLDIKLEREEDRPSGKNSKKSGPEK